MKFPILLAALALTASGPCFAQSERPRVPELRDTVGLMEQAQASAARVTASRPDYDGNVYRVVGEAREQPSRKALRDQQMRDQADKIELGAAAEGRTLTLKERERVALLRAGAVLPATSRRAGYLATTGVQIPRLEAFVR